jgi:hypothetical protein
MTNWHVKPAFLAIGLAGFLASGLTAPATAEVLYDNLGETSQGAVTLSGNNPANSFSTGSSAFLLQNVTLLLGLNGGTGTGSFQVFLVANHANSPHTAIAQLGGSFTPAN